MTKYINVEKLKALLDAKCKEFREKKDCPLQYQYMADGLDIAERFVDSLQQEQDLIIINKKDWEAQEKFRKNKGFGKPLQQEQPEELHFTPLYRLIQKIPSENWNDTVNNYAKKLRDCLIKEGYRKDAEVLQGYISYMNGNNVPMATMDEQEQPSLPDNLDEAAKEYMKKARKHLFDDSPIGRADDAFKAGAEWIAKQGFISEGIIYQTSGEDTTIELNEHIGYLEDCDKVIVNIRKKKEKK